MAAVPKKKRHWREAQPSDFERRWLPGMKEADPDEGMDEDTPHGTSLASRRVWRWLLMLPVLAAGMVLGALAVLSYAQDRANELIAAETRKVEEKLRTEWQAASTQGQATRLAEARRAEREEIVKGWKPVQTALEAWKREAADKGRLTDQKDLLGAEMALRKALENFAQTLETSSPPGRGGARSE